MISNFDNTQELIEISLIDFNFKMQFGNRLLIIQIWFICVIVYQYFASKGNRLTNTPFSTLNFNHFIEGALLFFLSLNILTQSKFHNKLVIRYFASTMILFNDALVGAESVLLRNVSVWNHGSFQIFTKLKESLLGQETLRSTVSPFA